jgi:hypothetical protein
MAATPPICDFGWKAVEFDLPGTDGKRHGLADVRGERGTLIMFICNHCPYVKAVAGPGHRRRRDQCQRRRALPRGLVR